MTKNRVLHEVPPFLKSSHIYSATSFGDEFGMATAVIGQVPEFNAETDSLMAYVERVKLFIQANGIEDARKVPVLLSIIGGKPLTSYGTSCRLQTPKIRCSMSWWRR